MSVRAICSLARDVRLIGRKCGHRKHDIRATLDRRASHPPPPAASSERGYRPPDARRESSADDNVWLAGVIERLVGTAPSLDALRKHHLHLAAARLWRLHGRAVLAELMAEARAAALRAMLARFILGKVRSAYGGALMLRLLPTVRFRVTVRSTTSICSSKIQWRRSAHWSEPVLSRSGTRRRTPVSSTSRRSRGQAPLSGRGASPQPALLARSRIG